MIVAPYFQPTVWEVNHRLKTKFEFQYGNVVFTQHVDGLLQMYEGARSQKGLDGRSTGVAHRKWITNGKRGMSFMREYLFWNEKGGNTFMDFRLKRPFEIRLINAFFRYFAEMKRAVSTAVFSFSPKRHRGTSFLGRRQKNLPPT